MATIHRAKPMSEKLSRCLRSEAEYQVTVTRPLVPFTLDPVHHLLIPALGREKVLSLIEVCTSYANRGTSTKPWFAVSGFGLAASNPDLTLAFDRDLVRHVISTYPLPLDRQLLNVQSILLKVLESGWRPIIDVSLPATFENRICNIGVHSSQLPSEIAEAATLFMVSRAILKANIYTAFFLVEMVYSGCKNLRTLANIFPVLRVPLSKLAGHDIPEGKVNLWCAVKDKRLRNLIPSINATLGLQQIVPKFDGNSEYHLSYPEIYVPKVPDSTLIREWVARQPG